MHRAVIAGFDLRIAAALNGRGASGDQRYEDQE
jgi:hypothetical protein